MLKARGTLPQDLVALIWKYGQRCAEGYVGGEKPQSISYATHGIEGDPIRQARAKAGECAVALCYGLNPLVAIDWSPRLDRGYDLIVRGLHIDVKRTELAESYQRLHWPHNKRDLFESKQFDVLALAKTHGAEYLVAGWITKDRFRQQHHVARPDRLDKLDEGDLFVMQDELDPVETLGVKSPQYRNNHLCHCGKPGTRARGFGPISELEWFCAAHDPR